MFNKIARIAFFILIPLSAFAGTTTIQVVSSNTKVHNNSTGDVFVYTDLVFTKLNGKKVVYECVQHGDFCPMVESGRSYTVEQKGAFIYITMNAPEEKKASAIKFRQVGSW